jgi:hypothetical protein
VSFVLFARLSTLSQGRVFIPPPMPDAARKNSIPARGLETNVGAPGSQYDNRRALGPTRDPTRGSTAFPMMDGEPYGAADHGR